MRLLEERILRDGKILPGEILKVDSFLNHCIDIPFMTEICKDFYEKFKDCGVNKILTIEASGIAAASITAQYFGCPMVFAKKSKSKNIGDDMYTCTVDSYTHGTTHQVVVSKDYLNPEDRVLIIDDFLATGNALNGLMKLVNDAGATLIGCGICIEKVYQQGGNELRKRGVTVESLAMVESMTDDSITFVK